MNETTNQAWHFCATQNNKPILRDRRPVVIGEWVVHGGPIEMCKSGLHASRKALDALGYAPGPYVCRVEVEDVAAEEDDKLVCRRRRVLWCYDATETLRAFARSCALDVIHLWDAPEVVRLYLETGNPSLRAAALADAAMAAEDAAWKAAWEAWKAGALTRKNERLETMLLGARAVR